MSLHPTGYLHVYVLALVDRQIWLQNATQTEKTIKQVIFFFNPFLRRRTVYETSLMWVVVIISFFLTVKIRLPEKKKKEQKKKAPNIVHNHC